MLKQIILSMLIIWLGMMDVQAQSITTSSFEDFDQSNSQMEYLAKRFGYYYFVRTSPKLTEVIVYDSLMKRKAIVNLDFIQGGEESFCLLSNRDGFVVLFYDFEEKKGRTIKQAELNDYLRITKRPKIIDTLGNDFVFRGWLKSPNQKFASYVAIKKGEKKTADFLNVRMYNQAGENLKNTQLPLYFTLDKNLMMLTNDGSMVIGGLQQELKPYSIWISKFQEQSFSEFVISENPIAVNNLFFKQSTLDNNIYFIADVTLQSPPANIKIRGFNFGYIDGNLKLHSKAVNQDNNDKIASIFEGDQNYKIKYLSPLSNGGMFIALEEYTEKENPIVVSSNFTRGGTYTQVQTTYILGNIHLIALGESGNLVWETILEKNQTSINSINPNMSFGLMNMGYNMTVFFNYFEHNSQRILKGFTVYPTGDSKEIYFTWKDAKKNYDFLVNQSVQISSNEDIMPVFSYGKIGLGKIEM